MGNKNKKDCTKTSSDRKKSWKRKKKHRSGITTSVLSNQKKSHTCQKKNHASLFGSENIFSPYKFTGKHRKSCTALDQKDDAALRKEMDTLADVLSKVTDPDRFIDILHKNQRTSSVVRKAACVAALDRKGIERIDEGIWSTEENERLKSNWKDFVQEQNLPAGKIDRDELLKWHNSKYWYIQLGQGIRRHLPAIYSRAKYLFCSPYNNASCTKDEIKMLENHQQNSPARWTVLAEELGCNAPSVRYQWKMIHDKEKSCGVWSPEEDTQLVKLVERYLPAKGKKHHTWTRIAAKMTTRRADQCRRRWQTLEASQSSDNRHPEEKFTRIKAEVRALLVESIVNMNVKDQCFLDWNVIEDYVNSNVPRHHLQNSFARMKKSAPNGGKDFAEFMKYLATVKLPQLKAKVKRPDDD